MKEITHQTLFILQGVPGSGKSTVSEALAKSWYNLKICCTDDYFTSITGEYNFDASKVSKFHALNQIAAFNCLYNGYSVAVPNTNLRNWEVRPYVEVAVDLNIPVVFIRCEGKFKNIHGVPEDKVEEMRNKMEHLSIEEALKSKAPWE